MMEIRKNPKTLNLESPDSFTATMTMSHLILSVAMTLYIFVGLYFEERGLVATLGPDYESYQQRVRMLVPIPKRTAAAE